MKINTDGKNNRITIEVASDEPWQKILDYLEALQWLIEGQKKVTKESFQDRISRTAI